MTFNLELNLGSIIKIIFIIFLLISHLIFLINEHYKPEELRFDSKYLKNGLFLETSAFKNLGTYIAGTLTKTSSIITIKNEMQSKEELQKKIEEANQLRKDLKDKTKNIQQLIAENSSNDAKILDGSGKIVNSLNTMQSRLNNFFNSLKEQLEKLSNNTDSVIAKEALAQLKTEIFNTKSDFDAAANVTIGETQKIKALIEPKKSFIILGDILSLLDKYDGLGKLCISLIVLNYLVISNCISILFIIYGNYLITKFNIEVKFPKFYKILALRIKYQKYYLVLNLSFIIIIALTEIIMMLFLLY